jgi:hypothetical protein
MTRVAVIEGRIRPDDELAEPLPDIFVYTSDQDGTLVVEIETHGTDDEPQLRIYLNEGELWDCGRVAG